MDDGAELLTVTLGRHRAFADRAPLSPETPDDLETVTLKERNSQAGWGRRRGRACALGPQSGDIWVGFCGKLEFSAVGRRRERTEEAVIQTGERSWVKAGNGRKSRHWTFVTCHPQEWPGSRRSV